MRFHFADARRHRQAAKSLSRALRGLGIDTGHTAGLDIAARMYGYGDRHELDACLGKGPPSAWDEDEAPGVVAARRERQTAALAAAGVPGTAISGVIDAVRPTARKPAPSPRATGPAPAVADGGIAAMLDAWAAASKGSRSERLENFVRRAYDGGFEAVEFRVFERWDGLSEAVAATAFGRCEDLHNTQPEAGLLGWLLGIADEPVQPVPHPSGDIPVKLERAVGGSGAPYVVCRLLRNQAPPPPTLADLGIAGWEAWEAALFGRPGLTVMQVKGDGHHRLVDVITHRAGLRGLPVDSGRVDAETLDRYVGRMQAQCGHAHGNSGPSEILLLGPEPGFDRSTSGDDVVMAAVAAGASVILFTRWLDPAQEVRNMMIRGVRPGLVRSMLAATGTWDFCGDTPRGRVEVIQDTSSTAIQGGRGR